MRERRHDGTRRWRRSVIKTVIPVAAARETRMCRKIFRFLFSGDIDRDYAQNAKGMIRCATGRARKAGGFLTTSIGIPLRTPMTPFRATESAGARNSRGPESAGKPKRIRVTAVTAPRAILHCRGSSSFAFFSSFRRGIFSHSPGGGVRNAPREMKQFGDRCATRGVYSRVVNKRAESRELLTRKIRSRSYEYARMNIYK